MATIKPWVGVLLGVWLLVGCGLGPTARGTLIGAAAGAALGAGTGGLISDPDLLGSSEAAASGDLSLDPAPTVGAGAAIGVVFGALVGAMVGRGYESEWERQPEQPQAGGPVQPVAF